MSITPNASSIKRLRLAKGWSQEDLAGRARVGERTVQRAELGNPTRPGTLAALADALGADVIELTRAVGVPVLAMDASSNTHLKPLGDYGPLLATLCDANNAVFHWRRHFSNTFEYRSFFMRNQATPVFASLEALALVASTISLPLHRDVSEAVKALKRMHQEILEVGAVLRNSSRTGYRLTPAADEEIQKMGSHTCDYADFHIHRAAAELATILEVDLSSLPLLRL
jgi:transcriptional regulator with XRE-family HTH domain